MFGSEQRVLAALSIYEKKGFELAALLVADTYMPESNVPSVVMGGTLAVVICQQIALMIIVCSTVASVNASN